MKHTNLAKSFLTPVVFACLLAGPTVTFADTDERTIVVRERTEASLLDGQFIFKLLRINGYSIDIKVGGESKRLIVGQSFAPETAECSVMFEEIATETRLARFLTNCS